jgi:hypothetical protein
MVFIDEYRGRKIPERSGDSNGEMRIGMIELGIFNIDV